MRMRPLLLAAMLLGCGPSVTPGMARLEEAPRMTPAEGKRPLLVLHRREACSASAPIFLLDRQGTFYGSVAPGQAALLEVPDDLTRLEVLSSVDLTAPLHTWSVAGEVAVPPFPGGVLLTPRRANARQCVGNGQYVDAHAATKEELESVLGESDVTWLEPRLDDGQRWVDQHRARLDEILALRTKRRGSRP